MEVDLHIHTIASDGTFTPEEVILEAKRRGLKALAITDHDIVDGIEEAKKKAQEIGIEFVQGIEISCNTQDYEVHILGYFLNLEDKKFMNELEELKKARDNRNLKHFANYLVEKGAVLSKEEAFDKYLGKRGRAYIPKENFPPERAVKMLSENGAFVSLAHPKLVVNNDGIIENMISNLVKVGLNRGSIWNFFPIRYKKI